MDVFTSLLDIFLFLVLGFMAGGMIWEVLLVPLGRGIRRLLG